MAAESREPDPVRTDLVCTECNKPFIAQLDLSVDGNHILECPYCAHEHCRVVKAGIVSGDRWDTRMQRVAVGPQCVWKSAHEPVITSTAAAFIRSKWLSRVDVVL